MTLNLYKRSDSQLYWVTENVIANDFPGLESALRDPDGLLAIGGDLSLPRILDAYHRGIFPWYNAGQPIMWWSPDPRCIIELKDIHVSRSLGKVLRQGRFVVTLNHNFEEVISQCAAPRQYTDETWITPELKQAFIHLHKTGYAHSVECWQDERLVGGLYGLAMGRVFFGESMFSRVSDASKVALVYLGRFLKQQNFRLIDCQIYSAHLRSLGAKPIQRKLFANLLSHYCQKTAHSDWHPMELTLES